MTRDCPITQALAADFNRVMRTTPMPNPLYTVTLRYNDPIAGRRVIQDNIAAVDGPAAIAALRREYDPTQPADSYHSAHAYLTNPKQGQSHE